MIEKKRPPLRLLESGGQGGGFVRRKSPSRTRASGEQTDLRVVASNGDEPAERPDGQQPEPAQSDEAASGSSGAADERGLDRLSKPWVGALTALVLILLVMGIIVVFGG